MWTCPEDQTLLIIRIESGIDIVLHHTIKFELHIEYFTKRPNRSLVVICRNDNFVYVRSLSEREEKPAKKKN